ncbi:hypothetical protein CYMTET_24338 [Cymbomonas tetramitiformis]|uniref:EF-hand domain-containing protein n=1 Tax=Cymbomonas tetramitiformis TaxID=36881 RepID=A0AAE0FW31_9CHLO|nr:hypothetical protein CYMTET_24338 [Cymbomonas tetramitiformis]
MWCFFTSPRILNVCFVILFLLNFNPIASAEWDFRSFKRAFFDADTDGDKMLSLEEYFQVFPELVCRGRRDEQIQGEASVKPQRETSAWHVSACRLKSPADFDKEGGQKLRELAETARDMQLQAATHRQAHVRVEDTSNAKKRTAETRKVLSTVESDPENEDSNVSETGVFMTINSGACSTSSDGECLMSPNYPDDYNYYDDCEVSVSGEGILSVQSFSTEASYDVFYVDSDPYDGVNGPENVHVDSDTILRFTSDSSVQYSGFEICVESAALVPSPPPPAPRAPPLMLNGTAAYITDDQYSRTHFIDAVGDEAVTVIVLSVDVRLDSYVAPPRVTLRTLRIEGACADRLCEIDGGQGGPLLDMGHSAHLVLNYITITNFATVEGQPTSGVISLYSAGNSSIVISFCDLSYNSALVCAE